MSSTSGNPALGIDSNEPYKELADILRSQGWFQRPASGRAAAEMAFLVMISVSGIALFVAANHLLLIGVGLLMITLADLGISTGAHTASHNASVRRKKWNDFMVFFGYPFYLGMSASYWYYKHIVVHHPAPNIIEVDDDVDLMPFFAINEREVQEAKGLRRAFYKVQWVFVPLALALNVFNVQRQGWAFLLPILFNPKKRRDRHWKDVGVLTLHYMTWIVIPSFFFPVMSVLGFYVLRTALGGYSAFAAFAPAHFPEEAVFTDSSQKDLQDYLLRQTATTVNFRTGPIGRLLCAGVDFQIEHHLFPGISHEYYPEVSRIVKRYCEEHGYPYRTLGWWEAIWKSLYVFYRPKPVFQEIAVSEPVAV